MTTKLSGLMLGAALGALAPVAANAQVHVGVIVSETGPAAALGIPQKNTLAQLPREVAGQTVTYTLLDDATDPTKAVADARKLVAECGYHRRDEELAELDAVAASARRFADLPPRV